MEVVGVNHKPRGVTAKQENQLEGHLNDSIKFVLLLLFKNDTISSKLQSPPPLSMLINWGLESLSSLSFRY